MTRSEQADAIASAVKEKVADADIDVSANAVVIDCRRDQMGAVIQALAIPGHSFSCRVLTLSPESALFTVYASGKDQEP